MIDAHETFEGTYPFAPNFLGLKGARQHYVDLGEGRPFLLVHGEPSWSYLWREVVPLLARHGRVVAPDLMGFGKSDTPRDGDYSPDGQVDALERLVLALDLRDVTMVLHDWGGPIGGHVALRHLDRVREIVLVNSVLPVGVAGEDALLLKNAIETPYFRWMARLHGTGVMDTVLGEFGVMITAVMSRLQGMERRIDDVTARAYAAPFATPEECVGAIALPRSIVSGTSRGDPLDAKTLEALREKRVRLVYGLKDRVLLPNNMIPVFRNAFPEREVRTLPEAAHFSPEDAPDQIASFVLEGQ